MSQDRESIAVDAKVSTGMCLVSTYKHNMDQVGFHNTLLIHPPCFFCQEPEPAPARKRRGKQRMTTERKVQTSLIRGVSVKYMVMSMIYIIMSMLLIRSWVFMCCLYRGWWSWGSPPPPLSLTWPKNPLVRSKSRDCCPWSWPGKNAHCAKKASSCCLCFGQRDIPRFIVYFKIYPYIQMYPLLYSYCWVHFNWYMVAT